MNITLEQIRAANTARRGKIHVQDGKWSLNDWMVALTGEVGEAANLLKKVRRGDYTLDLVRVDLAKEFGDILCYLDLLASECGVDLGRAFITKFNEISKRTGSTVVIGEDGDWYDSSLDPVSVWKDQA